jgi:hypothetical protein
MFLAVAYSGEDFLSEYKLKMVNYLELKDK